MIYRSGRRVAGFGLGATATDPYAQAATDLADMQNAVAHGDELAAALDYTGAVSTYRTVGANGVAVLGPEINKAGAQQATESTTRHAELLNEALAGIAKTAPATRADADNASSLVATMLEDYLTAIRDGRAAQHVGKSALPQRAAMSIVAIIVIGVGSVALLLRAWPQHPSGARR
jgi:hypothetical protein